MSEEHSEKVEFLAIPCTGEDLMVEKCWANCGQFAIFELIDGRFHGMRQIVWPEEERSAEGMADLLLQAGVEILLTTALDELSREVVCSQGILVVEDNMLNDDAIEAVGAYLMQRTR